MSDIAIIAISSAVIVVAIVILVLGLRHRKIDVGYGDARIVLGGDIDALKKGKTDSVVE